MVYWVVVRSLNTGEVLNARSYRTHKEAAFAEYGSREAPDPEGHACKVEIEILQVGEYPQPKPVRYKANPL